MPVTMTATASATASDDALPPELLRVAAVAGLGALLLNLNATTLNVALDALIKDLHTTLDTAQWVITGYLLALTLVLPLFRWATERFGVRRLYLFGIVAFTVTSALCAGAWSIEVLVALRVIQGVSGGLLTPIAQTLAAQHAGPQRIGRLLSLIAVPVLAAPLLGPVLGGVLVEELSWRWVFLFNVPFGVVCSFLCARYLPRDDAAASPGAKLDVLGLALVSPSMALVVFAIGSLRRGGHAGIGAIAMLVCASVLVALFVRHARVNPDKALVDPRLFRQRTVAAAVLTYILGGIVVFGGQILLPLFFQQVRGESPLRAGLWQIPQGLGMLLTLPRIGKLTDRYDPGKLAIAGAILSLAGTAIFVVPVDGVPPAILAALLFVRGAGLGATANPTLAAVYRQLPRRDVPNATTALNIVQRMGAPLGTAIITVVLQWRLQAAASPAHAFAETFAVNVVFCALTAASASLLVGAGSRGADAPEPTS
jgi:EmrB/QacA subfamily drug resistance transporter